VYREPLIIRVEEIKEGKEIPLRESRFAKREELFNVLTLIWSLD